MVTLPFPEEKWRKRRTGQGAGKRIGELEGKERGETVVRM